MVKCRPDLASRARSLTRGHLLAGCAISAFAMAPVAAHAQLISSANAVTSAGGQTPVITTSGTVTDITLSAARTILNWSSFGLGADQTAVYRFQDPSWIVLNRVTGQAVIDGRIEATVGGQPNSGNVWFASPGGVIFGPNARVNVGGLLATTGTVAQAQFLDPANLAFGFTGANAASVQIRGGAELKSGTGPLALISGAVTAEARSTVIGGSVLYAAASDFTVRFAPQPGGLDLLDFIVPAGGGTISTAPLSLLGDTVGRNVMLAVVNRADVTNAVINAAGLIAAQSARSDGGDVVLTAGVDIVNRQPGTVRTNAVTETQFSLGIVSAQRDLIAGFGAPTSVRAEQMSAGRDLAVAAASLDSGTLNAGRTLIVDASRDITLRSGASAGGTATFRSNGAATVGPNGVSTVGRLQMDVGSVSATRLSSGRSIVINASGAGTTTQPAVKLGTLLAEDDILATATNAAGSIVLDRATITGARTDEAPFGRTLSLTARGAQGDVTYGTLPGGSVIDGATRVLLSAGRDVTANVAGLLTLSGGSAGRDFTIRAGDLDITGPITAMNLRVESLGGALRLGSSPLSAVLGAPVGADADPGMLISAADFQQITVTREASFYAGSTVAPGRGDLTVLDLRVDVARVPQLLLAAGGANDIRVTGVLAPITEGGVLTIGEDDVRSPWRPGRILVTGAIGFSRGSPATDYSDLRPFDQVNLNALRDIILGTQRFISLVQAVSPADINISANRPAGVAPTDSERDRVFLTANSLTLSASDRIVQQNTGTVAAPNGVLITSRFARPGALSVTPARVVDLFGAFRNGSGSFSRDFQPDIRSGGATTPTIRFNGCVVTDTGCSISAVTRRAQKLEDLDLLDPALADGLFSLPPEPQVLTFTGPEADVFVTDPVTLGTGSDELWRRRKASPAAAGRAQ